MTQYSDDEIEEGLDALVNCTVTFENADVAADVARALRALPPEERRALAARAAGFAYAELVPSGKHSTGKDLHTKALKHLKESINGTSGPARPDVQRQEHAGARA